MEMSIDYIHQFDDQWSQILVKTPLFPVKYQIRSYSDKELSYDRAVIYFQWPTQWKVRLHADIEEMVALYRRLGTFIQKKIKEGHLEVMQLNIEDFKGVMKK